MMINCPNCGNAIMLHDAPIEGQYIRCPGCRVKFAYGSKGSSVIPKMMSKIEHKDNAFWKPYVAICLVMLLGIVAMRMLFFATMRSGSGNGWKAWERMTDKGEREIRVLIQPTATREYLKNLYKNGFMISVLPEDRTLWFGYADGIPDANGNTRYSCTGIYDIFKEEEWRNFQEKLGEDLKATPAKEILSYLEEFK